MDEVEFRVSSRARRMRITVDSYAKVVLVYPKSASLGQARLFLERKREWIEQNLRKVVDRTDESTFPSESGVLELHLQAIGKVVLVRTQYSEGGVLSLRVLSDKELVITVGPDSIAGAKMLLVEYVRELARSHLGDMVRQLSEVHGLFPSKVIIRIQKTKWGSCSQNGTVSLNAKLMFLPPEYVEMVILHELAHLKHLNHSPQFWELLSSMLPQARALRQSLRRVQHLPPLWMRLY